MKNSLTIAFLLLCTFSLLTLKTQAQDRAIHVTTMDDVHEHTPGRNCHAHTNLLEEIRVNPALEERLRGMEEKTQQYIREHGDVLNSRNTRVIPVYVHVIYRTTQENISAAQIQSQMSQLNADFAATNADYNPPSDFATVAAGNTNIQFNLVNIYRYQTNRTEWGTNDAMKDPSQGGVAPITPSTHLNMWVCNIGGSILGYAQFPGTKTPATDGVVMSPQFFGSRNYGSSPNSYYLSAPFDRGRTTTHEVGHYLNLRHIWGDGGCSVDDGVSDTPIAGRSNGGCPNSNTNTCSGGQRDMFMNYMDYTDDRCMFMFTKGQTARMVACLNTSRANLGTGTIGGGSGGGGGSNCLANPRVRITTDRYGSETSWEVTDSRGRVVASRGNFGNSQTRTNSLSLSSGQYTLTVFDSYGDGMCCSYGNGKYELLDGSTVIATGGNFGSSESVNFCVGSGSRTSVQVTEIAAATDVVLYPNPANSVINIDLGEITTNYTGRIVDATGRTVWVGELEAGANAINIATLSTGMYYVAVVKADGQVITKKFVKE